MALLNFITNLRLMLLVETAVVGATTSTCLAPNSPGAARAVETTSWFLVSMDSSPSAKTENLLGDALSTSWGGSKFSFGGCWNQYDPPLPSQQDGRLSLPTSWTNPLQVL